MYTAARRGLVMRPSCRRPALLHPAVQQIINPDLGRSSTGALAIHAVHIPTTTKILVWGRQQPSYEPGMFTDGTPEVSSVFDFATGRYVKAPMRLAPFCSGKWRASRPAACIGALNFMRPEWGAPHLQHTRCLLTDI